MFRRNRELHDPVGAHVIIAGKVQGVFFRASAEDKARSLGLTGWVRNNADGTVEAFIEGERNAVEKMIAWCHKGPLLAQVTSVDVDWREYKGTYPIFSVR